MSEPRIISPLLDGFALGASISEHSGVRCFPAMRQDSDERYIVKTISIPATQLQLDALLLTGAYPDAEGARVYFQELAQGIRSEIELWQSLAQRRGFLACQDHQIVPMAEGVGYEVHLLSYYRRTLQRHLKKEPLTHLSAVNLGIDLCAALADCRQAGFLYVDLKPSNIFVNTAKQAYHIGDLGFVSLDSLAYAALPDRYRSDYTAPEVADAFAAMSGTMDIYALGLTLYQIYNNASLPFDSAESKAALMASLANGDAMPPPAYADYEMAAIICKACAYDPAQRYQTPQELAEDLISYMKRNGANDVPIVPPVIPEPEPVAELPPEEPESVPAESEVPPEPEAESPAEAPSEASDTPDTPGETAPEADWIDRMDAILSEDTPETAAETPTDEPSLRQLMEDDNSFTPVEVPGAQVTPGELSADTAEFLSQVQDLIDHEAPAPAVAPEPIEVPMPDPILPEPEEPEAPVHAGDAMFIPEEDESEPEEPDPVDEPVQEMTPKGSKTWKRMLTLVILLLILGGGALGGWYYYQNYYLQHIDAISVTGEADYLVVTVDTDMDQSLLTVVCKDTYGNARRSPLTNGQATFDELQPGSQYIITLEVDGYHQLVNATPASFSTPERTQIVDFNAVTGAEDGSVILSFGVEGPESENWTMGISAEGEEPRSVTFTGHTCTVTGLTPGVSYTFTITGEDVYLIGESTLTHTASALVFGQNLTITGYTQDSMTVSWQVPEGVTVEGWTARCYNEEGFEQILPVTESTATFTGITPSSPYILEVTALGMTQSARTFVTANPVTITGVTPNVHGYQIDISWTFEGTAPAGGWLVLYSVDGKAEQQVIESTEPSVTISPVGPGSHYDFVIQTADATTVFNGTGYFADVPSLSGSFSGYGLTANSIDVNLYRAPEGAWNHRDLPGDSKTTTFAPGSTIALVYSTQKTYGIRDDSITTLMVLRDSEGRLAAVRTHTRTWDDMWNNGYCQEEFPSLPTEAGEYQLSIYLHGMLLTSKNITITG